MEVITNHQIKNIDWEISDDLNAQGNLIFTYDFYVENRNALLSTSGRSNKIGVILNGEVPVEAIVQDLTDLDMIALDFPNYVDGRCFSHARLLRDAYQYQGDILAIGDILRDQIAHLERCGVNLIKFTDHRNTEDALQAFSEFTTPYQSALDDLKTIPQLR